MTNSIDEILGVLDRASSVDALDALVNALDPKPDSIELKDIAIGLDANVFLRIASDKDSELIIDYLSGLHKAPLILPGQAIQEFWNNQHEAFATMAKSLRSQISNLKSSITRLEDEFADYLREFDQLIERFEQEHGNVYEQSTLTKTAKLLDTLKARASVPFVQRSLLHTLSKHRKTTKTPPGFKDSGDGDFYVWADFLLGLREAQKSKAPFAKAILVTNDTKKDWSRDDRAHPILVAEARSLLKVPFETWTLKKLVAAIQGST